MSAVEARTSDQGSLFDAPPWIVIESNGSKWAGEAQDTIERLIEVLADHTLDPVFEDYGNFVSQPRGATDGGYVDGKHVWHDTGPIHPDRPGAMNFFGNFLNLSHVFNITTDDAALIERLTAAIRANQATDGYKAARPKAKLKRAAA